MFDADPDEHFYGLGQHQHGLLDQKGAWTGNTVGATGWVTAAAPLERIPVYLREGGGLTDLRGPS